MQIRHGEARSVPRRRPVPPPKRTGPRAPAVPSACAVEPAPRWQRAASTKASPCSRSEQSPPATVDTAVSAASQALAGEPASRNAMARARCTRTREVSRCVAKCACIASAAAQRLCGLSCRRRGPAPAAGSGRRPAPRFHHWLRPTRQCVRDGATHLVRRHAGSRSDYAGRPTRYLRGWPRRSGAHGARTSAINDCASSRWPPCINALQRNVMAMRTCVVSSTSRTRVSASTRREIVAAWCAVAAGYASASA